MLASPFDSKHGRILGVALLFVVACGAPAPEPTAVLAEQPTPTADARPPVADVRGGGVTVRYLDDGFHPERVAVEAGGDVTFVNESDVLLWPASNIHPTHQAYPGFDALGPIEQGESWTFTFDRPGEWRYHNHLVPRQGGVIVVEGQPEAQRPETVVVSEADLAFEETTGVSADEVTRLFQDDALLEAFVERYGPAATVELLSAASVQAGECHQRAHDLGRIAYGVFGAAAFSLSGHECQSGGYHGATEALFSDRGTAELKEDVAAICGGGSNSFFRHQCVHGIGHGLMAWTTYELLDGLALCDELGGEADRRSCYSGVFMENVVGGLSGSMGHITDYLSDDPHYPCNILSGPHVQACYFYQTSRMVQLFGGDFARVAEACAEAPATAAFTCFQSMGRDVGGATRGRPEEAIALCGYVGGPGNRRDCLVGAVQDSFWDTGGADLALRFCGLLDAPSEKGACYETVVGRALSLYEAPDQLAEFCERIEPAHRGRCP